ncbi:MAG: VIT1/CCC1 transporter family protein [Phycisphaerae bacterium]|nr:VIT1/CCC1 transporter family protein [Phycisphaerae bacterium]
MVLSFTGTLSVADAQREDVRTMILGALGCNLAWGIVDGVMYLSESLVENWRKIAKLRSLRAAQDPAVARSIIADALPPVVASVITDEEYQQIRERLLALPEPPPRARLSREDWLGAGAVCLLVFLSTFPVVIPFLFLNNLNAALRTSNLVALALLFFTGFSLGASSSGRPWRTGLAMMLLGVVLVGITIALGG